MTKEKKLKIYDKTGYALLALMVFIIYLVWDISKDILPVEARIAIAALMTYKFLYVGLKTQ